MQDLKCSFDLAACATSFNGFSIFIPCCFQTLQKQNILNPQFFQAYMEVIKYPMSKDNFYPQICRNYGTLLNNSLIKHTTTLLDARIVLNTLRSTCLRMMKYSMRKFQISVLLVKNEISEVAPFPVPFRILMCDIAIKLYHIDRFEPIFLRITTDTFLTRPLHKTLHEDLRTLQTKNFLQGFDNQPQETKHNPIWKHAMAQDIHDQLVFSCNTSCDQQMILFSYFSFKAALCLHVDERDHMFLKNAWVEAFRTAANADINLLTIPSSVLDWDWLLTP